MYKVINFFTDLQDNEHPYKVGDNFPRNGVQVTKERIIELLSDKNLQMKPLIEEVKSSTNEHSSKYSKTDIAKMNKGDLILLASEFGIENASDKSGNELKQEIIKKLNL